MTGPASFRRLSQVGTQLANKVTPRGSMPGGSGGAVGSMSLPPARGFRVVATAPTKNKDGTYKTAGHVAIVAQRGDHHWVEGKSMTFGHHAMSNVPLKTIADDELLLPDGKRMPPGSLNIYPGSGLMMEPNLYEGGDAVSIDLGPLSPKQVESFAELIRESYEGAPIEYQRAGVAEPNCVRMVAIALARVFGIAWKTVEPKPLEAPVNYVARVGPAVLEHVGQLRSEDT